MAGSIAVQEGASLRLERLAETPNGPVGGAPAWCVSQAIDPEGTVEKIDNTSGTWFIQGMKTQFEGDLVYKLPHAGAMLEG